MQEKCYILYGITPNFSITRCACVPWIVLATVFVIVIIKPSGVQSESNRANNFKIGREQLTYVIQWQPLQT